VTPIASPFPAMSAGLRAGAASFLVGILFAAGLVLSGMTLPAKVIGFLDLGGGWDPSLAFVMAGAIVVYALAMRLITKRRRPIFEPKFYLPTRKDIDLRLVAGAAIFGAGWGLGGVCPGPALVGAASGALPAVVFVAAMFGGMELFRVFEALTRKESS
jgi:uncharacterized protein